MAVSNEVIGLSLLARHRRAEEDYRNGSGHGGLFIPEIVHESLRLTPQSNRPDASPEAAQATMPEGDPVKELVGGFGCGRTDFEALAASLLARWQARSGVTTESADWAKVYSRCEQLPDDDDLLWISVAEDRGTLTVEQADALFSLIEAAAADGAIS